MPCGWLEVSAMIRSYHSYLLFTLSMPTMLFHQERKQWLVTFVVSRFVQVSLGSLFPPQSSRDAVPCASSRSEGSASEQSSQPKRASSNQEWVRGQTLTMQRTLKNDPENDHTGPLSPRATLLPQHKNVQVSTGAPLARLAAWPVVP